MKKRIICFILTVTILTGFLSAYSSSGAEQLFYTQTGPTLYVNDEPWYKNKTYTLIIRNVNQSGTAYEYYVPISIFEYFDLKVEQSAKSKKYLISDPLSDRYISFDLNFPDDSHLAITSGGVWTALTTHLYYGERYVPVDIVADAMGLTYSIFRSQNDSKYVTLRVCNGNQKKTFEELIKTYDPDMLKKSAETTPPAETSPSSHETTGPSGDDPSIEIPPEEVDSVSRTVYLTFEDGPNEYTEQILDILDEYGYKATFFIVGDNIPEYTDLIVRMAASGHSVGLHTMTADEKKFASDLNLMISELHEENNLLMRIIKQKSHIIRAPGGSSTNNFYLTTKHKEMIQNEGYVLWDWNIDSDDTGMFWHKNVSAKVIENIPKLVKSVVRFTSTKVTVQALPEILDFIKVRENYTVKSITASDPEVNFAGIYDLK